MTNTEKENRYKEMAKQYEEHKAKGGDVFNFNFVEQKPSKENQTKPQVRVRRKQ